MPELTSYPVDLTTTYLGLELKNPLVASASPLSKKLDLVRRLEDAGAAAMVLYSLFEEQITHESRELDHYLSRGAEHYAEALNYFPDLERYNIGPEPYLEHLHRIKQAVGIPVIASLNGVSPGGWVEYARKIEQAGADALELNIYYLPTDLGMTSAKLEANYLELVQSVAARVTIPVAVKLSPFFTALPNMARRFAEAGARGLRLVIPFYAPDLDLKRLDVVPHTTLSTSPELRLTLSENYVLDGRVPWGFAAAGGVETADDVLKAMMAGANVAMMTSEL